ncbi:hypothetical protein [Paraburkholderia elongata]|uniref:Uncharacterized protein n=1 Tax=Paraburkholderia elongata TaxID=2675747 RepID=A0A972NK46_9BURK|nr:hypothetical protein [Paraburkholderia elongata]NPT53060.1 hypothetical protein [Paraburkholderia elongata]
MSSGLSAAIDRCIGHDYGVLRRELRGNGVTLQPFWEEYAEANPGQPTYRYTQFSRKRRD